MNKPNRPFQYMERIQRARTKVQESNDELMAAMVAAFTPGTRVIYERGVIPIFCTVTELGVGHGDRVHVCGSRGKEYWIGGYRLRVI